MGDISDRLDEQIAPSWTYLVYTENDDLGNLIKGCSSNTNIDHTSDLRELVQRIKDHGSFRLVYDARDRHHVETAGIVRHILSIAGNIETLIIARPDEQKELSDVFKLTDTVKIRDKSDLQRARSLDDLFITQKERESAIVLIQDLKAREKMKDELTRLNLRVYETINPKEALQQFHAHGPILVCMQTPLYSRLLEQLKDQGIMRDRVWTYIHHRSRTNDHGSQWSVNQEAKDITNGAVLSFYTEIKRVKVRAGIARLPEGKAAIEPPMPDPGEGSRNNIYIFKGPSGAGKSTLVEMLSWHFYNMAALAYKTTTRKGRPNESSYIVPMSKKRFFTRYEDGVLNSLTSFAGNYYALDKSVQNHFRSGRDVFLCGHMKDDFRAVEVEFRERVVKICLYASESELSRRIRKRQGVSVSQRIQKNKEEEIPAAFSPNQGFRYIIRTDMEPLGVEDEHMSEKRSEFIALDKAVRIIRWERAHEGKDYVDTLVRRLTGFGPKQLEEPHNHTIHFDKAQCVKALTDRFAYKGVVSVSRRIAEERDKVDPLIYQQIEGLLVLGVDKAYGIYNVYLKAPVDQSYQKVAMQLLISKLSAHSTPSVAWYYDAEQPRTSSLTLSRVDNTQIVGIIHYRLTDELQDIVRGEASLDEIERKQKSASRFLNVVLVHGPQKNAPLSHSVISPSGLAELYCVKDMP